MRLTFAFAVLGVCFMGSVGSLAGCYSPNVASGAQQCSQLGQCPEGFTCFPDKRCYKPGATPDCNPACSGATRVCDKTSLKCVQCLADKDCPDGALCDLKSQACKPGCNAGHASCGADAGSCDVDLGSCRGCLSDAECPDMANPRCDLPSGRCVPCVPMADNCPTGRYCSGANGLWSCVSGCKVQSECAADGGSMDCCNHKCVDTTSDKTNCGVCGKTCENGNTCCSGSCADPSSDVSNCGGCGMACMLQNVMGPMCVTSICAFTKCNPGFGDCDLIPTNGCETNIGMDPKNCGGCGMACGPFPNAIPGCAVASCTIMTCMKGFADCDGAVKNGCEVDTFNDVKNCNGCGNVCPNVINGVPGCTLGKCGIEKCNTTFRDCDMNPMNGCEANILMDPKNCGGCGTQCSFPNAGGACANGNCSLGTCNPGFANCDLMPANGCEVNTNLDINNCGMCGNKCAQGLMCIGGTCKLVCPQGRADCDGNQANGCEVNTNADPLNCGACAKACAANTACGNGVCGGCLPGFADCDGNPMNGCEVNLNSDPMNCGKCKIVCPLAMAFCGMGVCMNGCLAGGKLPPAPCSGGNDPETMAAYTICKADCNGAWIANASNVGGKYHALQICQSYGYGSVTMFGGTCGIVCGYCDASTCMNPSAMPKFDGGGNSCGMDQFGPILCTTVHWLCAK